MSIGIEISPDGIGFRIYGNEIRKNGNEISQCGNEIRLFGIKISQSVIELMPDGNEISQWNEFNAKWKRNKSVERVQCQMETK